LLKTQQRRPIAQLDSGVESHPGANPADTAIRNQYQDQISQRRQAASSQELLELMAGKASESQIEKNIAKLKR